MSPDQRTELESLVAAHMPSVSSSERERLLFDSARELGRQQGSRQAVRKSIAAAAVSCGLTLLLSWSVVPGLRGNLAPAVGALPDSRLADNQPTSQPSIVKAATKDTAVTSDTAQRIAASHSATFPASRSPFDQHVLTPVSWSARWELSHVGSLSAEGANLEPADGNIGAASAEAHRAASTPLRASTPLDQL
jgi:hypothetical protein